MVRWYGEVNNIAPPNHTNGYNPPRAGSLLKSYLRGTMPALLTALITLALITPADAAPKRPLRPVCTVGTLTQVEGTWMCLVPPKWVR